MVLYLHSPIHLQCTLLHLKKSTESRSPLFCDVMQGRLVVTDVSGQPVGAIFKGQAAFLDCLTLEDGAGMLFRNVGSYQSVCVTFQKSEDVIYTAEEASIHAQYSRLSP